MPPGSARSARSGENRTGYELLWKTILPAVALGAFLAVMTNAVAQAQARQFARECAQMEITAITMIEDHGTVEDLPADQLGNAGLTMLRARTACYGGRVSEALALYQSILDLGPVASLRAAERK